MLPIEEPSFYHWISPPIGVYSGQTLVTSETYMLHTSVATTQIYAEVLMEDKIAAVNKLNGIF